MSAEIERRWDDAVEQAWVEFRQRVADRLAGLEANDVLLVEVGHDPDDDGATVVPYCQALGGPDGLRLEAVSNTFLTEELELGPEQEAVLRELGFRRPSEDRTPNFWLDLDHRQADRAAVMIVEAMRRVYGVLHPVFLDADGLEPQPETLPGAEPAGEADDQVVFPGDLDDVRAALSRTVGSMLGHEPEYDDDGDLPLVTDRAVLYITIAPQVPRILLHASLVFDVVDGQRALVEVNLLNKREFGLTFVFSEGRIVVRRELPVSAFVPDEIRNEVRRICDRLDDWVSDLLARVGGKGVFDEGAARPPQGVTPTVAEAERPEDPRFRQALRVLRELEGEERGSVDPAVMLRIFHSDRDLLLSAIRYSASRSSTWGSRRRKAEEEGKAAYARMCRSQQRYYHELRGRQRAALRLAVQVSTKRERQAQLSLFSEDEAASS